MPSASKIGTPRGVSGGKMRMPMASSLTPSSVGEHNMPSLAIPRILRRWMSRPSGITVPSVASGTTSPASMLNAPHHTCRSTPSPAST
jgi:hypothetical protein